MEKKQNMSNVDELCVKYVFDELDPSEVTIVEQAMTNDQNLLIEVESLKSTWRKLQKLPELTPPANISKAVIDQARDFSNQQQFFGNHWRNPGLLATAAIVLFSLLVSTAYLLPSDTLERDNQQEGRATASMRTSTPSINQIQFSEQDLLGVRESHQSLIFFNGNAIPKPESTDSLSKEGYLLQNEETPSTIISPVFRDFQLIGTR